MSAFEQFPFVELDPARGAASRMPYVPVTLQNIQRPITATGLVDTGAAVSVMPYSLGIQLGADWNLATVKIPLGGGLAGVEARGLLLVGQVGSIPPVRLAFAWAENDSMPLILGHLNFFEEFDVCFFRGKSLVEVRPKSP